MTTKPYTVRLSDESLDQLAEIGRRLRSTKAYALREAIRHLYLHLIEQDHDHDVHEEKRQ